jgi:ABC-2 type transport system ATP-binding protein
MRRRLELAQALVHEPEVLFLDEPTLGLDVSGRNKIWEHIKMLKAEGMTIFVTTHYLEEAEKYCNRVAIIDKGRIVVVGSPENLTNSIVKKLPLTTSFWKMLKLLKSKQCLMQVNSETLSGGDNASCDLLL